jgi:cytochrome c-type biogenesis protein CcmH
MRENAMNIRNSGKILILLIFLFSLLIPVSVGAQDNGPTDDDVNAIAKQLFCPVCENIPLDTCGTAACEQWRGIIRDKLSEGWSEDQIKNYFVEQYGDRVLAEPPARGFNWVIYIVPLVIFISGGYLFFRGFQEWQKQGASSGRRRGTEKAVKRIDTSDEYINRVEEELKKRSEDSI